jgi:plasmid maintenance system killer protein
VEIGFINKEQEELCTNQRYLQRKKSRAIVKSMARHLANLAAAQVLSDMHKLPGKFEELIKDRAGQFSLRLDEKHRLILEPTTAPIAKNEDDGKINLELARKNIPRKSDGGIDLKQVKTVIIVEAVSPHYE